MRILIPFLSLFIVGLFLYYERLVSLAAVVTVMLGMFMTVPVGMASIGNLYA